MASIYTQISKRIGWNGYCAIPSAGTAAELLHSVKYHQCESAFELAFKIHRFAPSPENAQETLSMFIINEAYTKGKQIFN